MTLAGEGPPFLKPLGLACPADASGSCGIMDNLRRVRNSRLLLERVTMTPAQFGGAFVGVRASWVVLINVGANAIGMECSNLDGASLEKSQLGFL